MHTGMAVTQRRYNPGVMTATLLMGPHAVAGARRMNRSADLPPRARAATAAFGLNIGVLPIAMKLRMRLSTNTAEHA